VTVYSCAVGYCTNHNDDKEEVGRVVEQQDFIVDDESGRALVRVQGATFSVAQDHQESKSWWDGESVPHKALRERLGKDRVSWIEEQVIEPGERVAVVGRVRMEASTEAPTIGGSYREPSMRPVIEAAPGLGLLVTDETHLIEVAPAVRRR
jgi:hypothetical protein